MGRMKPRRFAKENLQFCAGILCDAHRFCGNVQYFCGNAQGVLQRNWLV